MSRAAPEFTVIKTQDGSHTLHSSRYDDSYHSKYGAIQESQHIYIEAGLAHLPRSTKMIEILELGFGTGLNFLLTRQYAQSHSIAIKYHTYEPFPVPETTISLLNYGTFINDEWYTSLHALSWNEPHQLSININFCKFQLDIRTLSATNQYDLIYFDAFAPDKQPELWEKDLILKISNAARCGAVLVTYCCQGKFQRILRSVGFDIEKLPGPPGKREIIRAIKK